MNTKWLAHLNIRLVWKQEELEQVGGYIRRVLRRAFSVAMLLA